MSLKGVEIFTAWDKLKMNISCFLLILMIDLLYTEMVFRWYVFRAWGRVGTTIGGNKLQVSRTLSSSRWCESWRRFTAWTTIDKTSETTVRNLLTLLSHSCQLLIFSLESSNKPLKCNAKPKFNLKNEVIQ